LWWLVFTFLYPARRLVQRAPERAHPQVNLLRHGVRQVVSTLGELWRKYPMTLRYLIAYLIYNDGIQTVIVVAALFAAMNWGSIAQTILLLVLMIQFVAFFGALLFGRLAGRIGAKKSIVISLFIWSGLVIFAYGFLYNQVQLFIMGVFVAIVLGGSQALSRSLFLADDPARTGSGILRILRDQRAGYLLVRHIRLRPGGPINRFATHRHCQPNRLLRCRPLTFALTVDVRRAIVESGNDPKGIVL
jgi:MFS transporter, UMF1 family